MPRARAGHAGGASTTDEALAQARIIVANAALLQKWEGRRSACVYRRAIGPVLGLRAAVLYGSVAGGLRRRGWPPAPGASCRAGRRSLGLDCPAAYCAGGANSAVYFSEMSSAAPSATTRLFSMRITRSQNSRTAAMLWVTNTMVVPRP